MLVTSIFFPFLNKFEFFSHVYFVVCKCFQFGPVNTFVAGNKLTGTDHSKFPRKIYMIECFGVLV